MAQQSQQALTPALGNALGAIAEAVEGGAGLPEVARACGRALDASIVVVDASSAPLLQGAVLDFKDGLQGAGFAIENPNATRSCGCGKSFS